MICTPTRILMVEDTVPFAAMVQTMLKRSQEGIFTCAHVQSIEEIKKYSQDNVDLVLLDLTLPDSSGTDSVKRTRKQLPGVPIVVLTGYDCDTLAAEALQEGADDYIVKGSMDAQHLLRSLRYAVERDHARKALESSRHFLRSTLDALSTQIAILDETGTIIEVNDAWRGLQQATHSYQVHCARGINFLDVLDAAAARQDATSAEAARCIRAVMKGERAEAYLEFSSQLPGMDGWYILRVTRFGGQEIRVVVSIDDMSERKRTEQKLADVYKELKESHDKLKSAQAQLIQAAKMESVGRLAAGVAHEVKNPLAILQMGVEFMGPRNTDESGKAVLEDMDEAVRRAYTIINGLLDFSAPTRIERKKENVGDLVRESLHLVSHEMAKHGVRCETCGFEENIFAPLDHDKITQVFVNLLMNAVQSMPDGGDIKVSADVQLLTVPGGDVGYRATDRFRLDDSILTLTFEDTGSGVTDEALGKLFDPFFTTKPVGQGTGLGLSVTKSIVELHGGTIAITNRKTSGARVTVRLPMSINEGERHDKSNDH